MFIRTRQGTVDVISSKVAINRESVEELGKLFDQCASRGQPRVVLDLKGVPLIDSAGLEQLLDAQEKFESCGGALKLSEPTPLCQEIFLITGVASQLESYGDLRSAIGSFVK